MRFLLAPFGSSGDLFPFLWMGRILQETGHEVSLIAPLFHQAAVERSGLKHELLGEQADIEACLRHPDLWHPVKGPFLVFQMAADATQLYFDALVRGRPDRDTILLAPCFQPAGRLVREKFGSRLWTVHLQPGALLSVYDTPELGGPMRVVRRLPRPLKRLMLQSLPNPFDLKVGAVCRRLCAEHGMRAPRSFFRKWWNSPDGVLLMFAKWFAAPQPDWPKEAQYVGFPRHDTVDDAPDLSPELIRFLEAGDPPIVVSFGSAMMQGAAVFEAAIRSIRTLGYRIIVASRYFEFTGARDEAVLRIDYAPFSQLFPCCKAAVHHGGIGTLSQAVAAGIPQCVVPFSHDQFDNARRLRGVGVATSLPATGVARKGLERALRPLLEEEGFSRAAVALAERTNRESAKDRFLEIVEQLRDQAPRST